MSDERRLAISDRQEITGVVFLVGCLAITEPVPSTICLVASSLSFVLSIYNFVKAGGHP